MMHEAAMNHTHPERSRTRHLPRHGSLSALAAYPVADSGTIRSLLTTCMLCAALLAGTGEFHPAAAQRPGSASRFGGRQTTPQPAGTVFSGSPVVEDGAVLQQVATGMGFTEGPVSDDDGNLYFVDIPLNSIYKVTPDGRRSSFVHGDGCANGLDIGPDGVLYAALNGDRAVVAVDERGNYTVVADSYNGKRLNNPNDLWIDDKGGIYFTDPSFYLRMTIEQDGNYVYYITPDRSEVIRVIDDTRMPNGIVGTKDNKTLYVAAMGQGGILKYSINEDGTLSNKSVFVNRGADGMTIDSEGNLYLTSGGITVFSPEGELLETIAIPESPANCCFGGPDRKTLYITARTSLYAIRMKVSGF